MCTAMLAQFCRPEHHSKKESSQTFTSSPSVGSSPSPVSPADMAGGGRGGQLEGRMDEGKENFHPTKILPTRVKFEVKSSI